MLPPVNSQIKHFNLVSLGCPKNRVDSERILSVMDRAGFLYTQDASRADIIIINTCAFIEPAVEESIEVILDYRAEHSDAFLVVAGCLPLRYREELKESLPEVDLFVTPDHIGDLPGILTVAVHKSKDDKPTESPSHPLRTGLRPQEATPDHEMEYFVSGKVSLIQPASDRILSTQGYAYLKIAEGCSRSCRYCTIPTIRGPLRSVSPEALEQEAGFFASIGVRELVLTAQDLTSYGIDHKEKNSLLVLLARISRVKGIKWIRLMYLHPDGIPQGLGKLITESENILPYLDIPFQHVSDKVLKGMGRPWKGDRIRKLVDRLRSQINGLVLRTTLMVGFPVEGEKEFAELQDFVRSYHIEHVGVFEYSPEEGTPALSLGDPIPGEVKQERAEEIRRINSRFMAGRNRRRIGTIEQGLVEGISLESEFLLQGRTWDQAPEVDGVLYITEGEASVGEIHNVKITGAHGPDIFGAIQSP